MLHTGNLHVYQTSPKLYDYLSYFTLDGISELESENSPADLHGEWADEELEYGEPEDNEDDSYTVVENDAGER